MVNVTIFPRFAAGFPDIGILDGRLAGAPLAGALFATAAFGSVGACDATTCAAQLTALANIATPILNCCLI
jgi:hypothetical protein